MVVLSPAMSLLLLILMGIFSPSNAHTFYVGGDDGWTLHPSKNYSHWAESYRFLIHDELVFKYKKGHDSVLVVNHNDYSIKALKADDSSVFKLMKSGPFFFINGHDQNCEKGQKLNIIVLSPRHHNIAPSQPSNQTTPLEPPSTAPTSHHAPPSSSPSAKTPANLPPIKPPFHSPSPSPAAKTHAHVPPTKTPSHSLSPSPEAKNPSYPNGPSPHTPSPAAKIPACGDH